MRLLGEKLVPQHPVSRDAGAVRMLEEGGERYYTSHRLHDQHRVRRRAPGIDLPRVTAEAKRAAIREMPI